MKYFLLEIHKIKAEKLRDSQEVQADILKAKSIKLEEDISKEIELEKQIKISAPVKYSADISLDTMRGGVRQCLAELKTFYRDNESNNNPLNVAKLWSSIKKNLENVPNIYIFQSILRQISLLDDEIAKLGSSLPPKKSSASIQEDLVPKLRQMLLTTGIEAISQKAKLKKSTAECSDSINQVTDELEELITNSFEDSYQEEDLIREFVSVMLKNLVLKAKIQHANEIVKNLKSDEQAREKNEKHFATTVQETRNIYNSIEEKVYSVQMCVAQMHQMHQKLNFGKISMVRLVQDLEKSVKYQGMNRTMMSLAPGGEIAAPLHSAEIQLFLDIPVDKFNSIEKTVLFELSRNHILIYNDETALLLKNSALDITTLSSFFETMKQSIDMNLRLQAVTRSVKPKFAVPSPIPIDELKKKLNLNREDIAELLDQTTKTIVTTKSLLRDLHLYYNYALTNPLKKFIPAWRKYEGKTYKAYETDFNLYYRMIKDWATLIVAACSAAPWKRLWLWFHLFFVSIFITISIYLIIKQFQIPYNRLPIYSFPFGFLFHLLCLEWL